MCMCIFNPIFLFSTSGFFHVSKTLAGGKKLGLMILNIIPHLTSLVCVVNFSTLPAACQPLPTSSPPSAAPHPCPATLLSQPPDTPAPKPLHKGQPSCFFKLSILNAGESPLSSPVFPKPAVPPPPQSWSCFSSM